MVISPSRVQKIRSGTTESQGRVMQTPGRLAVRGKFLYVGADKLWVRGVTYGAFDPGAAGVEYGDLQQIQRDFVEIAANGFNTVRIPHTTPPPSLLNMAARYGLRVMVGLSAEQYVGYLIDRENAPDIEEIIRSKVRRCAGHPALLCYAIGNEISASLVRWLGRRRVERYLERLCRAIKSEDPAGLVTYVNYPSTEYLELPFLDFVCFNVYLESQDRLEAYLQRLQNLAGDRPLVMSEIGLDSFRNGEDAQAHALDWQIRTAFAGGCAGAIVFSWTDEWFRAGAEVKDWAFGLTDRGRHPKPALAAVRNAFADVPFPKGGRWPRISVVVCSYNGARTIRSCFDGLLRLEYPDFEVIVVNDGSRDDTEAISREYGFTLISTENRGLSNARNTGLEAATGEIVAYIDDDASPDPHWLTYLAATFLSTTHAGVGGPNITPPGDGATAECVANAPGGPIHVLLSDTEAEHIPGCNMAFRKRALTAIGGFDPQFRTAGDDVDVCWRLRERGWTLGFSPAAMVWHHRRHTVRAYWKQQRGYGRAEALLERKWPAKYNGVGHLAWAGRVYGNGAKLLLGGVGRIYHGLWGGAPFQSLYQPAPSVLAHFLHMPESYLVVAALALFSLLGILWRPLLVGLPLLCLAVLGLVAQAWLGASHAGCAGAPRSHLGGLKRHVLTALLHLLQPLARLQGRVGQGLTPWRWAAGGGLSLPPSRAWAKWTADWVEPHERLLSVESALRARGVTVERGGSYDRWDLHVRGGALGAARILMAVEEHGAGTQYVRVRSWPLCSGVVVGVALLFVFLAASAWIDGARGASAALVSLGGLLVVRVLRDCRAATSAALEALKLARLDPTDDDSARVAASVCARPRLLGLESSAILPAPSRLYGQAEDDCAVVEDGWGDSRPQRARRPPA
jgi:GT2 family glycosyltransferase